MTVKNYAHILSKLTNLKFGMIVYNICFKEGCDSCCGGCESIWVTDMKNCRFYSGKLGVYKFLLTETNLLSVAKRWNVCCFADEEAAQQALKEFDKIRAISEKELRVDEYANWVGERLNWIVD